MECTDVNMNFIVYVRADRMNFIMERFTGENNIFALCESGIFSCESVYGKSTVLPLSGFLFKKGVDYVRKVEKPVRLHLFRYECDEDLFENGVVEFADKQRILSTLDMLNKLFDNAYPGSFEFKKNLFTDIVNQHKFENASGIKTMGARDLLIKDAADMLAQCFAQKIDLTQIAKSVNLSYPQFYRRFKKQMLLTPFEYIASLRMQKAQHLLVTTDMSIKEISYICGFDNEYYFSKFFKSRMNVSPAAYRRSLRQV